MFPHLYRMMMLELLDFKGIDEVMNLHSADFYRIAESARTYILKHESSKIISAEVASAENAEATGLIIVARVLSEEHPENPWPWREALTATTTEEECPF